MTLPAFLAFGFLTVSVPWWQKKRKLCTKAIQTLWQKAGLDLVECKCMLDWELWLGSFSHMWMFFAWQALLPTKLHYSAFQHQGMRSSQTDPVSPMTKISIQHGPACCLWCATAGLRKLYLKLLYPTWTLLVLQLQMIWIIVSKHPPESLRTDLQVQLFPYSLFSRVETTTPEKYTDDNIWVQFKY